MSKKKNGAIKLQHGPYGAVMTGDLRRDVVIVNIADQGDDEEAALGIRLYHETQYRSESLAVSVLLKEARRLRDFLNGMDLGDEEEEAKS